MEEDCIKIKLQIDIDKAKDFINELAEIANKCIEESKFYNLKIREFEDMKSTSVINSVDTDIQIMKTCFSIIGILATSNQFITLNPDIDGATR